MAGFQPYSKPPTPKMALYHIPLQRFGIARRYNDKFHFTVFTGTAGSGTMNRSASIGYDSHATKSRMNLLCFTANYKKQGESNKIRKLKRKKCRAKN